MTYLVNSDREGGVARDDYFSNYFSTSTREQARTMATNDFAVMSEVNG